MSERERAHACGLMRVNHVGEICAQALYQGQALTCRDPEVRNTQDGSRIVHLSVATSETWKDRGSGERKERTEWHRVVIFNDKLGEIAERYLRKGSKVYLEGTLQTRKWTEVVKSAGIQPE